MFMFDAAVQPHPLSLYVHSASTDDLISIAGCKDRIRPVILTVECEIRMLVLDVECQAAICFDQNKPQDHLLAD